MRANRALICWNPAESAARPAHRFRSGPSIRIGSLLEEGDHDWTVDYAMSGGAAYTRTRGLTGAEAIAQLFIDFHTIVVGDGVDPQETHAAFLAIEEYRATISPDIPGADRAELER